ncbi:alpha-2C adrenergic receptor-like protein [Dinothrombium tinctorium]|uniref:Alpha-2C adrenergic receptor-like protein n=1 Tax=Dinothrombium tinctorium TaxID=1965070 RepID=A0A443QIC0_9ACAR|nr:alpha-2C adrenergic receptor-like protein [Dinothrombium tinctorium]
MDTKEFNDVNLEMYKANVSGHFSSSNISSNASDVEYSERSSFALSLVAVNATNKTLLFVNEYVDLNLNNDERDAYNYSINFTPPSLPSDIGYTSAFLNLSETSTPNWWDLVPYPQSGYTHLSIILLAFVITCLMILIVVGNLLVCVAIATEKSLKTVQNWFITSLALSDLLLGLIIIPFSLAHELMGYWIFGIWWCDIHHALDVLLCTASINNLCLISLDRYWSVTQAVEYLKKRTAKRAMYMIVFVWIFSAAVSLPPLVGWKITDLKEGECHLSEEVGYVMYSALGSFYIPSVVMVFVYAKIFFVARSRARKHVKTKQYLTPPEMTNDPTTNNKSTTTTTCTSLSNPSPPDLKEINKESNESLPVERSSTPNTPSQSQAPKVTFCLQDDSKAANVQCCNGKSDVPVTSPTTLSPPEIVIESSESPHSSPKRSLPTISKKCEKRIDKCGSGSPTSKTIPQLTIAVNECDMGYPAHGCPSSSILKQNGSATNETRFISGDDDSDAFDSPVTKTNLAPESKSFLSAPKLTKSPFGSTLSIADYDDSDLCEDSNGSQKKRKKGKVQYDNATIVPHRHTPSDAERHRRRVAKARERRATLILGLIMGAFIAAWAPFFILYVMQAVCNGCDVRRELNIGYWIGYSNSAFNPIIYTVFNRDFRKAFRKILFR